MSDGLVLHVRNSLELVDRTDSPRDVSILLGNVPIHEEKVAPEPQLSLSEQWALEFSKMPLEEQKRLHQSLLPKRTREEEEQRARDRDAAGITTFRRLSFDFVPPEGDVVPRFPVSLSKQVAPVNEKQVLCERLELSPDELERLEETKACIYFDFYRLAVQIVSMFKPVVIICCLIFIYVRLIRIPWEATRSLAIWSVLVYNPHPNDTVSQEAVGSIYNGLLVLAFVVCVTAMYVVLLVNNARNVLLRILQVLNIALLGGPFAYFIYQILVVYKIPLDAVTFTGCVWNLIGVGWFALNYNGNSKTYLTRGFLIILAICMAWPFVEFPEPSMWATLALLVVYDLFAVLAPCGPLRYIMEAEAKLKREGKDAKPLPGLVYRGHYFIVGVGDLVFYGALMGQASVLGWEAGLGCLIGILMGVAGTILWTTSSGKLATPALPMSAVLGLCLRFAVPLLALPMCQALSAHAFFL